LAEVTVDGVAVGGRVLTWAEVVGGRVEVEFGRFPDDDTDDGDTDGDDTDDDVAATDDAEGSA
jgi:hypothetical protein